MSWSVNCVGKKEAVRARVDRELTHAAQGYAGTAEEHDVLAAKTSILTAIDSVEFFDGDWLNAVSVEAYGSRSKGYVSVKIDVKKATVEY